MPQRIDHRQEWKAVEVRESRVQIFADAVFAHQDRGVDVVHQIAAFDSGQLLRAVRENIFEDADRLRSVNMKKFGSVSRRLSMKTLKAFTGSALRVTSRHARVSY